MVDEGRCRVPRPPRRERASVVSSKELDKGGQSHGFAGNHQPEDHRDQHWWEALERGRHFASAGKGEDEASGD